ncbi:DUF92 domain-containing protein [Salinibaculum rarum]|uniref:DUF92 domain-containing protein n=1 Tax=Salinibaculum rarum TaxID=3058903 RepID=UPI00265D8B01|nr:DUF92 domain-containing protein [Salinibaculum sp. KK48]
MTSTVRRAAAFALVGSLAFAVPVFARIDEPAFATVATAGPFLVVAAFALAIEQGTTAFELFARPGDRRDGKLYGLAGFTLAAAGLAIFTVGFGMPHHVFVGTVLLVSFGNLGSQIVRLWTSDRALATAGFVTVGTVAAAVGQFSSAWLVDVPAQVPRLAFLATSGALLAALLRAVLFQRDDPLVMAVVAMFLWLFTTLTGDISTTRIAVALAVTVVLGYASYALETASLPGMLTGVLLGLWTIVLGDYGWFAMLIAFFGIGGLAAKYRYEEKKRRGIAEENEGARGSRNVLANSLVALVAVLASAASPDFGVPSRLFLFAFAGSVAAAMSDTLSSELGGLFDRPRLITTLQVVEPGTDGAVTWQGELAGLAGAAIVAAIALLTFGTIQPIGAGVIVAAGVAGMTVDSILGATIEGWLVGNQGVNFLATLSAALVGGALAVVVGLTTL